MSSIRDKLLGEILPAEWRMLTMHHRREALFLVDPALALIDVAIAVVEDRSDEIRALLEAGQLRRPGAEEVARFERDAEEPRFQSVIVQPFVLAQRWPAEA